MKSSFALIFLAVCACSNGSGTDDAGDAGKTPAPCMSDEDCANIGDHCYFVIDGACTLQNSKGVCMAYTAQAGCTANIACGCDGTTIITCAPDGYVSRSSNHSGACPGDDAGTDAAAPSDASPE